MTPPPKVVTSQQSQTSRIINSFAKSIAPELTFFRLRNSNHFRNFQRILKQRIAALH